MSFTQEQIDRAKKKQHSAAHDTRKQIRLVAGPGTGKSFAIEERVRWLLSNGVSPGSIYVVSFTRAASRDLRSRIISYCEKQGLPDGESVEVSTLHSLALKALRMGNVLESNPVVMDRWELENIFDTEFHEYAGFTKGRCKELREIHEASLATDLETVAEHRLPSPPTEDEATWFYRFHQSRSEVYRFVLPGEIVRKCVDEWKADALVPNPAMSLQMEHLIVDEFQDLNESDLEFVSLLIAEGVTTFVAGDDDQSIYSFRFATPAGIQTFTADHPDAGEHSLVDCFRCTTNVLNASSTLMKRFSTDSRIKKSLVSVYEASNPINPGVVHRWRFYNGDLEAKGIAESCKALIEAGVAPRQILILLANHDVLYSTLKKAFDTANVEFEPPRQDSYIDTKSGRFIYGLIRIVCDLEDYVAHRLVLGQIPNVGSGKCNSIVEGVIKNHLNYQELFHSFWNPPKSAFDPSCLNALGRAHEICSQISDWEKTDTLNQRMEEIANIVSGMFGNPSAEAWISEIDHLPQAITLEKFLAYLTADTDEQQERILKSVYDQLGLEIPTTGLLPPRVRVMTMHGSKGLDAQIVFIPGMEENILPRPKQKPYPGEINEAARMLYVAITRAKAASMISYAENRLVYGSYSKQTRSRFNPHLNGRFSYREQELNETETDEILQSINAL